MPEYLFKRGQIWWCRIVVDGHEYRRSLRTRSKAKARRRRDRFIEDLMHARFHGEQRHTFKEAVVRWCAERLPGGVAPATAKRYLVSARQLDPHFGDLYIDQIDRRIVAEYVRRRKLVTSNATIRRDLSALSSILSWCVAQDWRQDNPARDFDRSIIRERRDPIRPPSDDEIERFCMAAPPTIAYLARFLLFTGMRQEEAVSLEWRQLDTRTREITLIKTKTNRPRVVFLNDDAMAQIMAQPRHVSSPYVFWHGNGQRYRNFASRFRTIAKRESLGFRCHDLRHRFAVDYLKGGGDIYRLSRILGHTSVKTTEIYLGYVDSGMAQNMAHAQRSQ